MNEAVITCKDVDEFLNSFVELGDTHFVDGEQIIRKVSDDSPVTVGVNNKPTTVALFKEGMSPGNYVILNPFVEAIGKYPERDWLYAVKDVLPGVVIKRLLIASVEAIIKTKDKDSEYEGMSLMSILADKADEKMIKEFDKIRTDQYGCICYDASTKTAQLQVDVLHPDLPADYGTKIRKSTWELIRVFVMELFKNSNIEETFKYKSESIGIPRLDAYANILAMFIKLANPHTKALLNIDFHPVKFAAHLANLEKYYKLAGWFATGSLDRGNKRGPSLNVTKTSDSVPFSNTASVPMSIPTVPRASTSGDRIPLARCAPGTTPQGINLQNAYRGVQLAPQTMHVSGIAPASISGGIPIASSTTMNNGGSGFNGAF